MMPSITLRQAWSGEAKCLNCLLRTSVLFAGLKEADFANIHEPISQFTVEPGTVVYRKGEIGNFMFTVRSGLIKQARLLPNGTQRILRLARGNDLLGLEVLTSKTYQHNAIAMQRTELCGLPVKIIHQLGEDNHILRQELMRRWQMALQEADTWIVELSTGSAKVRVARLLLHLTPDFTSNSCELISREDMGSALGITTETASRIMAEFKRKGLISNVKSNQCVLDLQKLKQIAMLEIS